MKIPFSWLHDFVPVEVEPERLGEDLSRIGLALEGLETHGGQAVLDLDVTTNRVDCMNVYGVAREVATLYGLPLRPIDANPAEAGAPAEGEVRVEIAAPDLCGRFCARVLDVEPGPSPAWLRDRLELVGIRSISNVVDLTNYVMVEMGQPTHAFDLAKVPERILEVRWAREGERLVTLDGTERALTARSGVIAGGDGRPLALAGIMGGASSEVTEGTRTVALEAAWWEPLAVRRAARALGMHTEASHRFERGADYEAGALALARLAHLLVKTGAGKPRPGVVEKVGAPRERRKVVFHIAAVDSILGTTVPPGRAHSILEGLGFELSPPPVEGPTTVRVPSWRGDVAREVDLVEEVGRHLGLEKIATGLPPASRIGRLRPSQQGERLIREVLGGRGVSEVVNYAFVSGAAIASDGREAVRLANPLTEEQDTLRTSLLAPGLLGTLRRNLDPSLGRRDVAVFEMGRVFRRGEEGGVVEERRLAVLLCGRTEPAHWSGKPRPYDLFDLEGMVEVLARRLGVPLGVRPEADGTLFHPGRTFGVTAGDEPVGRGGALHPELRERLGLREEAVGLEISLEPVLGTTAPPTRFAALDRFPPVSRDVSILCDAGQAAADVAALVRAAAGPGLRSLTFADRYAGSQVPAGKVSLTLSLRFQDPGRTLTGDEVQAAVERVMATLREAGAEIRSE